MSKLQTLREKLYTLFANHPYREAHNQSRELLHPLAGDRDFFEELLLEAASKPSFFLQKRINPVLAFDIAKSNDCHLIAHCWIPRPDGKTDVSHQSIHQHGNLLLTSLAAFGPGYDSVLFRGGYKVDQSSLETKMQVEKRYRNPEGNIEFVETYAPHIVFYPEQLSITYALWSSDQRAASQSLKRLPILQKYKSVLKPILHKMGLDKALHVNTIKFLDFYAENGKVFVMPDRVRYPDGSNENYLRAFFYLLQKIGFKKIAELEKIILANPEAKAALPYLQSLKSGQEIENIFEDSHLKIPKVSIPLSAIYESFPDLRS